ncbi:MAG: hypothetical protein LBE35_10965 [Clostridiales bacterium]|jgi:hypothetical protein|nr:hypothetical protein [Clostridiales bacterium]
MSISENLEALSGDLDEIERMWRLISFDDGLAELAAHNLPEPYNREIMMQEALDALGDESEAAPHWELEPIASRTWQNG